MKKRSAGRVLAAAVAATVAIALSACGSSGGSGGQVASGDYKGPKVTISFWNGWTGGAAPVLVPKLIAKFNAEHKNIVVKDVPMEWGDIATKMPLAVKAGKGPDVAVGHGDDIATYAAQGLLLKADSHRQVARIQRQRLPRRSLEGRRYKGASTRMPWSVTPLGLYVNKDVLKRPASTRRPSPPTRRYLAALDKLKAAGVQGEWVDGYVFTGTFEFESLLWQYGGDLFNKDVTKADLQLRCRRQGAHLDDRPDQEGLQPGERRAGRQHQLAHRRKTAFNWNGVWQTTNNAFGKLDWAATAVPQIGTEKAVWSSSTHWMFLDNKGQDKNKTAAAATFVKWMNDNSAGWPQTGELPANNTVRNDPALLQKYPNLKPFLDELPYAHYETVGPRHRQANATITTP